MMDILLGFCLCMTNVTKINSPLANNYRYMQMRSDNRDKITGRTEYRRIYIQCPVLGSFKWLADIDVSPSNFFPMCGCPVIYIHIHTQSFKMGDIYIYIQCIFILKYIYIKLHLLQSVLCLRHDKYFNFLVTTIRFR